MVNVCKINNEFILHLTPDKESLNDSVTDRASCRGSSTTIAPPSSPRLGQHPPTPGTEEYGHLVQIVKDEGGLLGAGGVDNRGVEVELVDCLQRAKGEHLPDINCIGERSGKYFQRPILPAPIPYLVK